MKKIFVWMLTAIIALPSMSVSAQNVAKVGTTEYATTAEAMDAWKTNGGTLTLLADCSYESPLFSITKKDTLNLNGHTLSWTADATAAKAIAISGSGRLLITGNGAENSVLSFDCKKSSAHAIEAASASNILYIENVKIAAKAIGGSGYVVSVNNASPKFSVTNAEIEMGDYMQRGVYMQGKATGEKGVFSNVRIAYTGSVPASTIYAIYTKRPGTYENLIIDLSKVPADKTCYGLYIYSGGKSSQVISGNNTSFTLNTKAISQAFEMSSSRVNFTIEDGIFTAPNMLKMTDGYLDDKAPYMTITGGKFSTLLPYNVKLPAGKILQKGSDGYYTLTDGAYKYVIVGPSSSTPGYFEGFVDASACWDKCSSDAQTYTIVRVLTTSDDITIPSGKYVRLQKTGKDVAMGTVTNNGNLILQGTNPAAKDKTETVWNNKIINNGTLTLSATGAGTSTYGDAFVLENNGGSVLFGDKSQFTAKALEQVRAYIPEGYSARLNGDYYLVMENDASFVATVGGIGYDDLKEALVASTKDNPAKLCKDLTLSGNTATGSAAYLTVPSKSENPHCYLDMNGHNIIADNSNDVYLLNNNGSYFTITGTGTIQAKGNDYGDNHCMITLLGGGTDKKDVSVLEIGENVTIDNENYGYVIGLEDAKGISYGVRVDIAGKIKSSRNFASVIGNLTNTEGNVPVINILPTAEITVGDAGIYAAGYAQWNFAGKMTAESFGIEIRAGKLNMTGGSITCNATTPADDQFNGSGSTSTACGIAVCQHSTKLPIEVVVNDGEIKAYTPLYQSNPQNNETEMEVINLTVNGGKFFSTSKNIVWSLNKRITLNGGVYNLAPTAYAAAGKTVITNTDAATKDMYPYTIGTIASDNTFTTAGEWNTASNWSAGAVASADVPVKIAADVTISAGTKAEAYGIIVESGKKITIKEGGVLMVGKDGIDGIADASQLFIEDGGALLISPVAEASKSHPKSTNELKTTIREVKDEYNNGDATYQYIWKNIALPVQKEDMKFSPTGQLAVNVWDNDWEPASRADLWIPFKGYHITVHPTVEATIANPTYTFTGLLNGNNDATLTMNREGFHLFGNSWSAPLDVRELLNQIEHFTDSKVNTGVKVYISDKCTLGGKTYFDGQYVDITRDALSSDKSFADAFSLLGAHECFFLCSNASSSQVTLNYEKAVWNAMSASAKSSAPRRMVSSDTDEPTYSTSVWIELEASNGRNDVVRLFDSDKESSKKLMSEGPANVNIYAVTPSGEYSSFYASDLTDTELAISTNKCVSYTLSFRNVKGEPLYIKDIQTGVVTEMSEVNTYTFTAEPSTTSTRFRVVSRSEVTTDVDAVVPVAGKSGVYSLMGQYLGEVSVWETLPAGVYIANGTKVVK